MNISKHEEVEVEICLSSWRKDGFRAGNGKRVSFIEKSGKRYSWGDTNVNKQGGVVGDVACHKLGKERL